MGYERVEQVSDRGQFAVRGGHPRPLPGHRGARGARRPVRHRGRVAAAVLHLHQRSLGELAEVEVAPAAELAAEHREMAEIAAISADEERPDIAELLPLDRFHRSWRWRPRTPRCSSPPRRRSCPRWPTTGRTSARPSTTSTPTSSTSIRSRSRRPWTPRVGAPERVRHRPGRCEFHAQTADLAARSLKEAEPRMEELVRSGYRTVVTWPRHGEGERAAFNLARLRAEWWTAARRPGAAVHRRLAARRLHRRGPEARRAARAPALPPPARRAGRPSRDAARCAPSPTCARATSSPTRTTGSPASTGFDTKTVARMTRDYLSWSSPGPTRSSCRSTSWPRCRASWAPAARTRRCPSSAARAGRR